MIFAGCRIGPSAEEITYLSQGIKHLAPKLASKEITPAQGSLDLGLEREVEGIGMGGEMEAGSFCHWRLISLSPLSNRGSRTKPNFSCIGVGNRGWLLMCHDRVDGNRINLTHEFLALMLGVRRAGVTIGLHILENAKVISATPGRVEILSREALLEGAGSSYGAPAWPLNKLARRM